MSICKSNETPYSRSYIRLERPDRDDDLKIRIMQWNILAQGFIPLDEFVHCPCKMLSFERRCRLIAEEILRYDPDIVCLQEADIIKDIVEILTTRRGKDDYSFYFLPKYNSPCLMIKNNHGPDGLAVIYRNDKYKLIKTEKIPLNEDDSRHALFCHFVPKAVGSSNKSFSDIYLICLHLKAKETYREIRKKQGQKLINYLSSFIERICSTGLSVNSNVFPPIFICGDFNADPTEPVINLLQNFSFNSNTLYKLTSAYYVAEGCKEPEFTTWKIRKSKRITNLTEICHTVDYIWYCNQLCTLLGVWSIPSKREIGPSGLPSAIFPSDHMNLIADFSLCLNE
ncbi:Nocturnin isoform 2 [Schistosoma japonicum]|uniref:Nocturnin n=1 Tax=Schistosoma japonicum TaxID=6182 RepID=Q5DHV4_SCHJA|nr:SJCHGC02357 protein [Schistosoma japonicum]TNN20637.1 Nocturnin isoform 2 [Schistosoma japonicum]TNN20638.1 Nocturnin isoform 2 [Schistosoma japonicum]